MWLLETTALQSLQTAVRTMKVTDAQQTEYFAAIGFTDNDASRILSIGGGTANIAVHGILTKGRSFMSMFMGGGTTYGEILAAISEAEADPDVEDITFHIDSPGGQLEGMFAAMTAISNTSKPTKAIISNMGASAAFGLATQADTIEAASRAAQIGSVGIVASFFVSDFEVDISSTDAPKKRPDVKTEEGQAIVRERLDAIHDLFAESIAKGRGTTTQKVNRDFGKGDVVLADKALTMGMIDSIAESDAILSDVDSTDPDTDEQVAIETVENVQMDIDELKAKHPDIYQAAVKQGVDQERDRVTAHLIMGESSGDTKSAIAAIKDGSEMTAALQATYFSAGMSRKDVNNRQSDDDDASAADDADDTETDEAGTVASAVESKMGVVASA